MTPDQAASIAVDIAQHRGWGKNATPIDRWTKYLETLEHDTAIRVLNTLAANQTEAPTIAEFGKIYTRLNQPTIPHDTCPTCAGTGRIFKPVETTYDPKIPDELRQLGLEQLSLLRAPHKPD